MALEVRRELEIGGVTYQVAEHPAVPGYPYGQEGRQAVVYQLKDSAVTGREALRALKVFKAWHRRPELVLLSEQLGAFAEMAGLAVCRRAVLTPQQHEALLRDEPDLLYAVLMPWVQGPTWMEVMLGRQPLTPQQSLTLARSLAEILAAMEQRGMAHCDLSSANMILPALAVGGAPEATPVALVDVEQMYAPGLGRPAALPGGSSGYAHKTAADGLWSATADRYAGAILLAELLGWCDPEIRRSAWGESYFSPQELDSGHTGASDRFSRLAGVLSNRWGAGTAALFERAWRSETLAECATFGDWLMALPASTDEAAATSLQATGQPGPPAAPGLKQRLQEALRLEESGDRAGALQLYRQSRDTPHLDSGLADELDLIIHELERPAVAPSAFTPDESLDSLFDDAVSAVHAGQWRAAAELLNEVTRRQPAYQRNGLSAANLLEQVLSEKRGAAEAPAVRAPIVPENAGRLGQVRWLGGRPGSIKCLKFSPSGTLLAAGGRDGTVRLLRVPDGTERLVLTENAGWVMSVDFSPDGAMLAAGYRDGTVRLWRVDDGAAAGVLRGHSRAVESVAFSPDGHTIASASRDGTVRLWRAERGAPWRTFEGHPGGALKAVFSPDGSLLAVGAYDGLRLWRLATGAVARVLRGHTSFVRSLAFLPDGAMLVSGDGDGSVRMWRVADGSTVRTLKGHAAQVTGLDTGSGGELMASGGGDHVIRLWFAGDGTELGLLKGHASVIDDLCFSKDGTLMASCSYEGVRLWGVR